MNFPNSIRSLLFTALGLSAVSFSAHAEVMPLVKPVDTKNVCFCSTSYDQAQRNCTLGQQVLGTISNPRGGITLGGSCGLTADCGSSAMFCFKLETWGTCGAP